MCGIAGFNWGDESLLKRMTATMVHRGPDGSGHFVDDNMSLGHLRLSILDLSENGHQPMAYKKLQITYNGEIYNFLELRSELEKQGHVFHTNCDTEVILHAYEQWGQDCVTRFNGMWAFCIYDTEERKLFLSRDRFGIKPLHYYFDGKRFIFASELTALLPHSIERKLDTQAVNFFFYQKYIGDDAGLFENCHKLKPAENLIVDLTNNSIKKSRYYDLVAEIQQASTLSPDERLELLEDVIESAINMRLIADVPVGSFLSGGVDSSLISAIIARNHSDFKTFSIGFNEASYDESPWSKIAAQHIGTEHRIDYVDIDDALVETVMGKIDEPFGDSSILPTYQLSKITRNEVTVALSGDAGDELFGGYDTYKAAAIANMVPSSIATLGRHASNLLPPSEKKVGLTFKLQRFFRDLDKDGVQRHFDWMATYPETTRRQLLGNTFLNNPPLNNNTMGTNLLDLQRADMNYYLPGNILKKVDIASMLNSLEARVPFLDYRVVPLALSLPDNMKIRRLRTKYWLKEFSTKYIPNKLVHRSKRGFTVPISRLIKTSSLIQHHLKDSSAFSHGAIAQDYVEEILQNHMANRADHSRELWLVFVFNYWCSNNMSN